MDIILISLLVFMIISLLILYLLNRVRRTKDLNSLLKDLLSRQPSTIAFSLGYDRERGKYKNATITNEGGVKIRYDANPIAHDGSFIILKEHGVVQPDKQTKNGYRISGMDLVHIKCPDGYEGFECKLKPLCSGADVGKYKPLTYTQFNGLGLYSNTFRAKAISTRRKRRDASEQTHPRIRVHCLNDGKYELQTCPDNELLNHDLKCVPYDICTDRIDGFKHNYKISANQADLSDDQYYVCDGNVSVLRRCPESSVFSASNKICVSRSACFGKGDATIKIDANNYIQCNNDLGTKVHCEHGVTENANGHLQCLYLTCKPSVFEKETTDLYYASGGVVCVNDTAVEKMCDTSPIASPYRIKQTWAITEFNDPFSDWPKEIYDDSLGKCVSAANAKSIAKRLPDIRWTKLMPEVHKFDYEKRQFVCADGEYRIDYERNEIVPPLPVGRYVQTAAPCQSETLNVWQLPWRNYTNLTVYPKDHPVAVVGVDYDISALKECAERLWPVKDPARNIYRFVRITYTTALDNRDPLLIYILNVEECEDAIPPTGFEAIETKPTDDRITEEEGFYMLNLVGFGTPDKKTARENVWFVLSGGKYDVVRSEYERVKLTDDQQSTFEIVHTYRIGCPKEIRGNASVPIMWPNLPSKVQDIAVDEGATLLMSRDGIKYNGGLVSPGLYTLNVKKTDTGLQVAYRDMKVQLETSSLYITYENEANNED